MMQRLLTHYDHLLFHEYRLSYEALGLYRILFAGVYLLFVGVPAFSWLSEVPEFFYAPQPFNVARLFAQQVPPFGLLVALDIVVLLALLFVLFGFRTVAASLVLTVALLIGYSMKFSTGKIGHGIMLVIVPGIMAFSGWGRAWSLDQKRGESSSPPLPYANAYVPFLMALVLGFAMFTAGVSKWQGGWALPEHYGSFYHFNFRYHFWDGKQQYLAPWLAQGIPLLGWKFLDYTTLAFELLFLPAVLSKRWFQLFCLAAVGFHVATLLIFNIPYINNLLAYLLFIRWEGVVAWFKRIRGDAVLRQFLSVRSLLVGSFLFLLQHGLFMFVFNDHLVRDKLISPLSFLTLASDATFRDIRAVILLSLALLFAAGQGVTKSRSLD